MKSKVIATTVLAVFLMSMAPFSVQIVQADGTTTISASANTYIKQEFPTTNFGGSWYLWVTSSLGENARFLITFDLGTIPGGVTITSATLYLYMWKATHISRSYGAHRITSAWDEMAATWNNQPTFSSVPTSTATTGTTPDIWLSWDVTADVNNGYLNPSAWHGILIKDEAENFAGTIYSYFCSNHHDNTGLHPYLTVEYTDITPVEATIDIDPDTLEMNSQGRWITAYIELPESYQVGDIDVATILLEQVTSAELHPTEIGDHDEDGIPDLMVKFDRAEVIALHVNIGEVTLTLTGEVSGMSFQGSDTIMVH